MSASRAKILIVDDDLDIREVVRDRLKAMGFEVVEASDGLQAMARLREELPAITLLDLQMPRKSGLEVLKAIKTDPRTHAIPVVILTSSREEQNMVEGYKLGANAYIQKPVDFDQFRQIVKQLGLFWLVVNQPPPPAAFNGKLG